MILQEYLEKDNFDIGDTISMFEDAYMLHTTIDGVKSKWLGVTSSVAKTSEEVIDTWISLWDDTGDRKPKVVKLGKKESIVFYHQMKRRVLKRS